MGQVINFRTARQRRPQPNAHPNAQALRCPRCGADLWRIQGNGQIACGDCEQSLPLHHPPKSNT